MKRILIFIIVLLSVFSLISCKDEQKAQTGSLCVSTQVNSKTIMPSMREIQVTSYTITGSCVDENASFTKSSQQPTIVVENLIVGTWEITIEGKNAAEDTVVSQTQEVEIIAGQTKNVFFKLTNLEGKGQVSLTVKWPISDTSVVSFDVIISKDNSDDVVFSGTKEEACVQGSEYSLTKVQELDTGVYNLLLVLKDAEENTIGIPTLDVVHIYKDMNSFATIKYTKEFLPFEAPVISPNVSGVCVDTPISITSAEDTSIYYTLDGSDPRTSETAILYTDAFNISEPSVIKAVAYKSDMLPSLISIKEYNMKVLAPTFNLTPDTYEGEQTVRFISQTPDTVFYYTIDGTTPSKENGFKSDAVKIVNNTNLKVIASYGVWEDSEVLTGEYKIKTNLTWNVSSGVYAGDQIVTLTSTTPNSKIYYTTDESEPTEDSTCYTGPITIESGLITELKAIAVSPETEATRISFEYTVYELLINAPETWTGNKIVPGVNATLEAILTPSLENVIYNWFLDDCPVSELVSASGATVNNNNFLCLGTNAVNLDEGEHKISVVVTIGGVDISSSLDVVVANDAESVGEAGVNTNLLCSGGLIFYDKGNYEDGWRYLEAAPADLKVLDGGVPTVDSSSSGYASATDEFIFGYYRSEIGNSFVNGTRMYNADNCTRFDLGYGKRNTELLVNAMKEKAYIIDSMSIGTTSVYAARLCWNLNSLGYDDWFLPSLYEMQEMYDEFKKQGKGGFEDTLYWCSSEDLNSPSTTMCIAFSFVNRANQDLGRNWFLNVRPVRAF